MKLKISYYIIFVLSSVGVFLQGLFEYDSPIFLIIMIYFGIKISDLERINDRLNKLEKNMGDNIK